MARTDQAPVPRIAIRRVVYGLSLIVTVMVIGILGFRYIEGMDWVNALYFESMLATGQGPPLQLNTDAGKIFASIMAFVSVGSILTTIVYTLGPFLASFWRQGVEKVSTDAKKIEGGIEQERGKVLKDLDQEEKKRRGDLTARERFRPQQ